MASSDAPSAAVRTHVAHVTPQELRPFAWPARIRARAESLMLQPDPASGPRSLAPGVPMAALADLGVRRISVGGALALVGWGAVAEAAKRLKDGDFDALAGAMPGAELNRIFDAAGT